MDHASLVLLLDRACSGPLPRSQLTRMSSSRIRPCAFCMAHTPFTPRTATRQHHAHTVRLSSQTLSSTTRGQERTRLSSHQKAEPRIVVSHHQTHCGQLPIPRHRNPTVHADAGTYWSLAIESPSSIVGLPVTHAPHNQGAILKRPLQRLPALKHLVHRTSHRRVVDHLRRLARC